MSYPRTFFDTILKPSYDAWLADPLAQWKCTAAVSNADIMAERLFEHWDRVDRSKVAGCTSAGAWREHLKQNVCPDFGIVWDIHDGHKHVSLGRPGRQVSTANQTGVGQMGFGESRFGEGLFGGGPQMVVTLDDGSKRAVAGPMAAVMAMWESMLTALQRWDCEASRAIARSPRGWYKARGDRRSKP